MIKKKILLPLFLPLLALLLPQIVSAAEPTASALINDLAKNLQRGAATQIDFTLEGPGGDAPAVGRLVLHGPSFRLDLDDLRVAYDGLTQWTALPSQKTLSITEPTLEELIETNPFIILADQSAHYRAMLLKDAPKGQKRVILQPSNPRASILKSATIDIADQTKTPTSLTIEINGGHIISAKVKKITTLTQGQTPVFKLNPSDFPSFEVVDLR